MTPSRRDLVLTAFAAAAMPAAASAADKKPPPPAKKVFPFYDLYLGIPAAERTRFVMNYYLRLNGKPATGQGLYVVMPNGARTLLTQAADGRITRMPTLAELKDGVIDAAERKESDRYSLSMELQPIVRLSETIAVGDLHAAIEQCNAAIRKRAGLIGFAVPKMEQVLFVGASGGSSVTADGKATTLPLFKGMPFYRPSTMPGAQTLKFANLPTRALLSGKTK